MKNRIRIISLAGVAFSMLAISSSTIGNAQTTPSGDSSKRPAQSATTDRQSPFACDRLALDPVARKRHFEELGPTLRSIRKAVRELPDGYEFQFSPDPQTIAMVAEWASGERLCCPFFNIELRMAPEGGPFWLRLTGRKGTKDFIRVDAASWIKQ